MNHIAAFFNTQLQEEHASNEKNSYLEMAGDFFFTPVRYLANGREFCVCRKKNTNIELRGDFPWRYYCKEKPLIRIILAIVAFVPSILLGTLIKGLALLGANARERHGIAVIHNTLIPRKNIVGKKSIEEIQIALSDPYRRKIATLVIEGNGALIGPDDNIGLNHVEIMERIVLINTDITNGVKSGPNQGAAEVLSFQNFEQHATCPYSPSDEEIENEPVKELVEYLPLLKQKIESNKRKQIQIHVVKTSKSHENDSDQVRTFRSEQELAQFKQKFVTRQKEKEKEKVDRYFSRHPRGLITMNYRQTCVAEYLVKTLDVALTSPLPKKNWHSFEKIKRVFIVYEAPVEIAP